MPYTLGNKTFKNKAEITYYFRNYLKNNEVDTILTGEENAVMNDLIMWHPNYEEEWGTEFKVSICEMYKQKNYSVKSTTGIWHVFSYYKCIRKGNKEINIRFNAIQAHRNSIKNQIYEFIDNNRLENNEFLCDISDIKYKRCDVHVDHNFEIITFRELLQNYLEINKLTYSDIKYIETDHGRYLEDDTLWSEYHKKNAKLRIIHKKYNLTAKRTVNPNTKNGKISIGN